MYINVLNYGKLHTCEISMTDDNKVLGNKSKYENFHAKKNQNLHMLLIEVGCYYGCLVTR